MYRKRIVLCLVFLTFGMALVISPLFSGAYPTNLPAYHRDAWKPPKAVPEWDLTHFQNFPSSLDTTAPPNEPVHYTAQWEPAEGCLIAWPIMRPEYDTVFCHIVDQIQDVGTVFMLYNNEIERTLIIGKLTGMGVPLTNLVWYNITYDTWWTRDFGPQNVIGQQSGQWGIVDNYCVYGRQDNKVNNNLAPIWNCNFYASPIVCEGGNLCTDGMGRLFCTQEIIWENHFAEHVLEHFQQPYLVGEAQIRQAFWDYLNVELIILPEPPISPHLDMCAKLVDPETWIIGQWRPDDPNTPVMDALVAMLDTMIAPTGNPYRIFRVQQPPRLHNGYWRTYTNSYMQNGKVLVAIYGMEGDSAALEVFQQALPNYQIVGIDCSIMDLSGGAIHCSTHEIAQHDSVSFRQVIAPQVAQTGIVKTTYIPEKAILTAFPNPFNPSTVISFELRAASCVSLRVYDTAGRLVATPVEGWRESGEHEVTFYGAGLPSGIYLAQLEAGEYHSTQKLILLK